MNDDMPDYDMGALRELLIAAFTDKDLRRFCQDRRLFKPIVNYLGSGDALVDSVDKVIDYCEKRSLLGELLVEIQRENPRQYDKYAARLISGAMLPGPVRERVREVLAACNRRAIFTRMHAQMSVEAMFASLADCRATLQRQKAYVEPAALEQLVGRIIAKLDAIERWGADLGDAEVMQINDAKLRIIQDLLSLAAAANLSYSLPVGLIEDAFWTREEADQAPQMKS